MTLRRSCLAVPGLVALAVACGTGSNGSDIPTPQAGSLSPISRPPTAHGNVDESTNAPSPSPATGGSGAVSGGAPTLSEPSSSSGDVPCSVASIVGTRCITCHADTPMFGAPMPLTHLSDFQGNAKSDASRKLSDVIVERIRATDITRRMPPASASPLAAAELDTFVSWLQQGMPKTAPLCTIQASAGSASPQPRPAGGSEIPIEYNDPLLRCYRFLAHAAGDTSKPYSVGTTPDLYMGFVFAPPWKGMMYARSFKTVIGNAAVIHHWILYKDNTRGTDGDVQEELGLHPDGENIYGWAPGGNDTYFDPDISEEMPGDVTYTLEAHYNNTTGAPAEDASGVEICVTPTKTPKLASVGWLGTDYLLGDTVAKSTCEPTNQEPVHIIGLTPHMHKRGRRVTVLIHRASGQDETFLDQPFDWQYQRTYAISTTIMPGDTLKTTCTYSEPAVFGYGTEDEMCYVFVRYYPKGILINNDILGMAHGPDTCLE